MYNKRKNNTNCINNYNDNNNATETQQNYTTTYTTLILFKSY